MSTAKEKAAGHEGAAPERRRRLGWREVLLALSIVLMILGLTLGAYAFIRGGDEPVEPLVQSKGDVPGLAQGFLPEGEGQGPAPEDVDPAADPLREWWPVLFRLGFSFFAAFAIAYAVRRFIKFAVIVIGALLLVLFGLQYVGVVDVNWDAMSERYDSMTAWLGAQTASFADFVKGALPSAGMAAMGLVAGFKKR